MSITGLNSSLKYAELHSIAYLFTDAGAKDYGNVSKVLPIIQKKQVTVNFMIRNITIGSADNPKKTVDVYYEIARVSEGQVFDITTEIIKKVLNSITKALEPNYEQLMSLNVKRLEPTVTHVKLDASFTQLSISVAGVNSTLLVTNSKNETVTSPNSISSNNIQFLTFDVDDQDYTIETSADAEYSIRVGGISDLKILFGFSTNIPKEHRETSFRPLIGSKNFLSVFVSNTSLVKCLTDATFFPSNDVVAFKEFKVPFTSKNGDMYSTALIETPKTMFKIRVKGFDNEGNNIERIISSGLESVFGGERVVVVSRLLKFQKLFHVRAA